MHFPRFFCPLLVCARLFATLVAAASPDKHLPNTAAIVGPAAAVFAASEAVTGAASYQTPDRRDDLAGATDAPTAVVTRLAVPTTFAAAVPDSTASRLTNFSILACTRAGAQTVAVGFAIGGSGAKQILLRGVGPTLAQFGVPHALADPQLQLFNDRSVLIRQNDGWRGDVALELASNLAGAFPLSAGSNDAALIPVLAAGCYTAQVSGGPAFTGAAPASGVALIQVYDLDAASSPTRIVNFSARTRIGPGANVLSAGFTITGNAPKTLLVRGIGPGLSQFGVGGVLVDPRLVVFGVTGAVVASNDDWSGRAALSSAFTQAGAFPLPDDSKDAAAIITLPPDTYIVQLSSIAGTTGVALIELYELP